jgi:hypothetical protein
MADEREVHREIHHNNGDGGAGWFIAAIVIIALILLVIFGLPRLGGNTEETPGTQINIPDQIDVNVGPGGGEADE